MKAVSTKQIPQKRFFLNFILLVASFDGKVVFVTGQSCNVEKDSSNSVSNS